MCFLLLLFGRFFSSSFLLLFRREQACRLIRWYFGVSEVCGAEYAIGNEAGEMDRDGKSSMTDDPFSDFLFTSSL